MKTGTLAALCLLAAPLRAQDGHQTESWKTTTMEGAAFLGELRYQRGDMTGADMTFRDSLNDGAQMNRPRSPVMGLDLYRLAQLAIGKGDIPAAKQKLEILVSRYPDSEWSEKGRSLLNALADKEAADGTDEPAELGDASLQPEARLGRLQEALKLGRTKAGLGLCQDFLARFPTHAASAEVKLIEGVLLLKSGEAARAAQVLREVARGAAPLRTRAVYLLGAADLEAGDLDSLAQDVPEVKTGDKWLSLARIWRAAAADHAGRRTQALALYREVLKTPGESPVKAYAAAGVAADLDAAGKAKEALAGMGAAAQDAEHWGLADLAAEARLSEAHILYHLRRFEGAALAYDKFARAHAGHPLATLALYQEGLSLKRADRPREAIHAFETLAKENPDSLYASDAHLQLGQLYAALGQDARAVAHYESMGETGGKDSAVESLLLAAQVHYNKKRYREAIPFYWKFLEAAPKDPRASEAEELLLTSYWQGARTDPGMYKAASLYPSHPIVAHISWELGAQAYKAGRWKEAEESFRRFAADFPASPRLAESLFYRAECLAKLEDPGAAGAYRELARRFPKSPRAREAQFKEGMALFESGDYEESAAALSRVEGADRLASDAAFNAALALQKAGLKAKSAAALEKLVTRFPKHPKAAWAWLELGERRAASGKLKGAILSFAKAGPKSTQALFGIGRCRERMKEPAKARAAYEKLKALKPAADKYRLSGLLRLGLLYELEAKPSKALPLYAEILKRGPRDSVFELARRRLQALTNEGTLLTTSR